jgi:hypothetical protein
MTAERPRSRPNVGEAALCRRPHFAGGDEPWVEHERVLGLNLGSATQAISLGEHNRRGSVSRIQRDFCLTDVFIDGIS